MVLVIGSVKVVKMVKVVGGGGGEWVMVGGLW